MGCTSSWDRHAGMIPSDRPAEKDWAPPRLAAKSGVISCLADRTYVPPIRHAEKLQPGSALFLPHPCSLFPVAHHTSCMSAARSALRIANPGARRAEEHGRPPRPWPVELPAERPQSTSHKTHMACAVTCHLHPARPLLLLVLPPPATIRRGVSVLHAVLPSACARACVCTRAMTVVPLPRPSLHSSRMGWQHGCVRDCSLARAAVVSFATVPPVASASSACLLTRLDLSGLCLCLCLLSLSLWRFFALLSLCSFVSHPSTRWLLLSHTSSLARPAARS